MQSLDSRVVQLLSVTQIKTGSTQRAFAQPLLKLNTQLQSQVTSQLEDVIKGNKQFLHFPVLSEQPH